MIHSIFTALDPSGKGFVAVVSVVQGSEGCTQRPHPRLGSDDAYIFRASELQHAVEGMNTHLHFGHPTFVYT